MSDATDEAIRATEDEDDIEASGFQGWTLEAPNPNYNPHLHPNPNPNPDPNPNPCSLKVAGFAASTADYKRAIEIYEQVATELKIVRPHTIPPTRRPTSLGHQH